MNARRTALLVLLLHVAWLWDTLRGTATLYTRDVLLFLLPFKSAAGRLLAHGDFPALAQELMGGMPLWAHPSAEITDPLQLLYAVFPDEPWRAFGLALVVHAGVSALGAYVAARACGARRDLAAFAALSWIACGPVLSTWTVKSLPLVGLPWMAAGGALAAREGTRRLGLLAAALGTAACGLHADPPLVASGAVLACALLWARAPRRERPRGAGLLFAAGVAGLLLSGVALVPALHVMADSPRGTVGSWSAQTSLGWRWMELLAPGGLGVPGATGSLMGALRRAAPAGLFIGSLSVGASVLVAAVSSSRPRRRTEKVLLTVAAVLILLAHGDALPGMGAVWSAVHARFPEKLLLAGYLAVVLAVALACRRLRPSSTAPAAVLALALVVMSTARPVAAALLAALPGPPSTWPDADQELLAGQLVLQCGAAAVVALALWLNVRRGKPAWAARILVAGALVDGTLAASVTLLEMPAALVGPDAVAVRPAVPPGASVACCNATRVDQRLPSATSPQLPPWTAAALGAAVLMPTTGALTGHAYPVAPDVGGFDPTRMRVLMGTVLPSLSEHDALRLLANLGVTHLVAAPSATPGTDVDLGVHGHLTVHALEQPSPLVSVHAAWNGAPDDVSAARAAATDHARLPVVTGAGQPGGTGTPRLDVLDVAATVLRARTDHDAPLLLVRRTTWSTGWAGSVDGVAVAPLVVDGLHLGVRVPAGAHEVVLRHDVPGLRVGLAGSLTGLLGLALLLRPRRR